MLWSRKIVYNAQMTEKLKTRFRYAKCEDIGSLAQLFAASWRQAYRGIIPHAELERIIRWRHPNWWRSALMHRPRLIVMTFDNDVVGYASFGPARPSPNRNLNIPTGEIMELYLNPDHQGIGFGRQLFAAAKGELRKSGLKRLVVWALSENEQACEFYRNLGGRIFANTRVHFGEKELEKTAFTWPAQKPG